MSHLPGWNSNNKKLSFILMYYTCDFMKVKMKGKNVFNEGFKITKWKGWNQHNQEMERNHYHCSAIPSSMSQSIGHFCSILEHVQFVNAHCKMRDFPSPNGQAEINTNKRLDSVHYTYAILSVWTCSSASWQCPLPMYKDFPLWNGHAESTSMRNSYFLWLPMIKHDKYTF